MQQAPNQPRVTATATGCMTVVCGHEPEPNSGGALCSIFGLVSNFQRNKTNALERTSTIEKIQNVNLQITMAQMRKKLVTQQISSLGFYSRHSSEQ